jgi:L-asparagine transporter-like permease
MAIGAVLASASAINADYFGAAKLPVMLAEDRELPSAFHRSIRGKSLSSLLTIGILALLAVNVLDLEAISAATSGGFLIVFAAVNLAAFRLAPETGARRWVAGLAMVLCLLAFVVMVEQFLSNPKTVSSGVAIAIIIALSILIELAYRAMAPRFRAPA